VHCGLFLKNEREKPKSERLKRTMLSRVLNPDLFSLKRVTWRKYSVKEEDLVRPKA